MKETTKKWPAHTYDLKSHGSVYLFTRQNMLAPTNAATPRNQFVFGWKLNATGHVEYQRNYFGVCTK
jgi:hypothetical protein